jgi:hypothetical protein
MKGLIFIPDISGFTNFVKSIDMDLGVSITRDLLNEIIDNNPLDVELSEIEGDALLFYKTGKPLPLRQVFAGVQKMYDAFNCKFKSLKEQHGIELDLSLKFIVHYGEINVYEIRGFKKLYGQTVIESHSLLKNGFRASDYILITEDYISAASNTLQEIFISGWEYHTHASQLLAGLRQIGYYFFTYLPNKAYKNHHSYERS